MNSTWEKNYPSASNLSAAELDKNSSLYKMLQLVGENKQVIDFGCATGYFAQVLNSKGCQVTGVEVNVKAAKVAEQYCEQVIVADLDFVSLAEILPGQKFDVAVFGDVLEHLRDPCKVLEETRQLLNAEGYVVASIPNIAHGAIRLALLQGQFEYMEFGILDNTHLRFFTRATVEKLFDRHGYFIDVMERTKLPIFSRSNLIPSIEKNDFDNQVIHKIEADEDGDTLQFVIRAFPLSYTAFQSQYLRLLEEVKFSHRHLEQMREELEQAQIQIQEKTTELERSQVEIQEKQNTQAELERAHSKLQQTQVELDQSRSQLEQAQMELERSQSQLQQTQTQLERCQDRIRTMATSKFWKLRTAWFRLKHSVGLKNDE